VVLQERSNIFIISMILFTTDLHASTHTHAGHCFYVVVIGSAMTLVHLLMVNGCSDGGVLSCQKASITEDREENGGSGGGGGSSDSDGSGRSSDRSGVSSRSSRSARQPSMRFKIHHAKRNPDSGGADGGGSMDGGGRCGESENAQKKCGSALLLPLIDTCTRDQVKCRHPASQRVKTHAPCCLSYLKPSGLACLLQRDAV
jgi:hypothetical protein